MAGAPLGNRNGAKENRIWGDELRKAVAQDKRAKIRRAIEKQMEAAADGDLNAAKELADRLDGRPAQAITGTDGGPLVIQVVKFADDTPAG